MITLLMCLTLTMNSFLIGDEPKQDELLYVASYCFDYYKEYGKEPDSPICLSIPLLKKEIDSITYMLQNIEDNMKFITHKKVGRKLFFKNEANPEYQLFFDFENLKGGYIQRPNRCYEGMCQYQIVLGEKIKYKDKYLYGLRYKPVGFATTANWVYYYDEDGECVMITGGMPDMPYLRIDYFDANFDYDEKGNRYFR